RECHVTEAQSCALPISLPFPAFPTTLQWGRGLSTAEISKAKIERVKLELLQWGRGLSTAEIADDLRAAIERIAASMGPRSFDREMGRAWWRERGWISGG